MTPENSDREQSLFLILVVAGVRMGALAFALGNQPGYSDRQVIAKRFTKDV